MAAILGSAEISHCLGQTAKKSPSKGTGAADGRALHAGGEKGGGSADHRKIQEEGANGAGRRAHCGEEGEVGLIGEQGLGDWQRVAQGREGVGRGEFVEVLVAYLRRVVGGGEEGEGEEREEEERREIAGIMLQQSKTCMGKEVLGLKDYKEFLLEQVEEGEVVGGGEGEEGGILQSLGELKDCSGRVRRI